MAQILPRDLTAIPGGIINPAAAIIVDNEDGVFKGTPANVVDAGAPINTQPEAEAGVINTGRMSPLRVAQAIAALGVSQAVLASPIGSEMMGYFDRTQSEKNSDIVSVFDGFIPQAEQAAILAGTSTYDCTADIHAAGDAVDGTGKTLRFPGGTYYVGEVIFTGSNYTIDTAGVTFKQKAAIGGDHPIILFNSCVDVAFGDAKLIGNIATDTGEHSPGINLTSCKGVRLGSIYGTNIRGDVVYIYGRDSSYAEMSLGNYIARVSGTNIYRCLVAHVGGECDIGAIVNDGPVGYREYDAEPNLGGAYQPVAARIGYIYGGCVQITSEDAAIKNDRIEIGTFEAKWSLIQATAPAYPRAPGADGWGLSIAQCRSVKIGLLKLRDYLSFPVNLDANWDSIRIDTLDFLNCNQEEDDFKSIVVQDGTSGNGVFDVGFVVGATEAADRMVFRSDNGGLKVRVGGGSISATSLAVLCSLEASNLTMDCGSGSGFVLLLSPDSSIKSSTFTNAGSATLARESNNLVVDNVTGTFGTLFTVNTDNVTIINSDLNSQRYTYRTYNTNTPGAVASAATVTLPLDREVVLVSGTTNITSVTAGAANANRRVTLVFQGILTFTDGSNLKLASNFVTAADASITIACPDGTNWVECSRSTN